MKKNISKVKKMNPLVKVGVILKKMKLKKLIRLRNMIQKR